MKSKKSSANLPEFVLNHNDWILPRDVYESVSLRERMHVNFVQTTQGWFELRQADGVVIHGRPVTDKRLLTLLNLQQIQRVLLARKVIADYRGVILYNQRLAPRT